MGKTSLLLRFYDDTYKSNQRATIGVDYKAKDVNIDGEMVKLQVWDTAGQERFHSMTSAFYTRAQGVIVVFDVTSRQSFEGVKAWVKEIREEAPMHCSIMLCANKIDKEASKWEVSREEFTAYAADNSFPLHEASAATACNVTTMFVDMGRVVITEMQKQADAEATADGGIPTAVAAPVLDKGASSQGSVVLTAQPVPVQGFSEEDQISGRGGCCF